MLIYSCDATDYIEDKKILDSTFKDLVPTDEVSYGPKCVCTNSSEPSLPLNGGVGYYSPFESLKFLGSWGYVTDV